METYAIYLAYKDPRVPWYAKIWMGIILAYAFSPIDLIPDFIPVLGYLDDLVIVPAGIALAIKMIPEDVMAECRLKSQETIQSDRPVNWVVAAVIILVWLVLAVVLISILLQVTRTEPMAL